MTQVHPWIKSYPDGVRWDIEIEPGAGAADPRRHRREVAGASRRSTSWASALSYRELKSLADRAAKGLQALGVGPAFTSACTCRTRRTTSIAFFGVLKAGGTVVNYSPLDAAQVLEHKIEDSRTDVLVTLDLAALYPQMAAMLGKTRLKKLVVGNMAEMSAQPDAVRGADEGGQAHGRVPAATTQHVALRRSCSTTTAATSAHAIADPREADRRAAVHRRHDRPAEGRDAHARQSLGGVPAVLGDGRRQAAGARRGRGARAGGAAAVPHLRAVGQHAARHPRSAPS